MELESILGNINAKYPNSSHVDTPSEVKVLQTESSLEDLAVLAARMGMVHYISTHICRFYRFQLIRIPIPRRFSITFASDRN